MDLEFQMIFKTHGVRVHRTDSEIRCWKFTNEHFDFSVFTEVEDAVDYISAPFPTLHWKLVFDE